MNLVGHTWSLMLTKKNVMLRIIHSLPLISTKLHSVVDFIVFVLSWGSCSPAKMQHFSYVLFSRRLEANGGWPGTIFHFLISHLY